LEYRSAPQYSIESGNITAKGCKVKEAGDVVSLNKAPSLEDFEVVEV
jgi:hypothetical protein